MITPRDYQAEAVDAARRALAENPKTLIISPTASGKSVMIAMICEAASRKGNRVLSLCMQGEILDQNETTLNRLNPDISTGIYCAGQGRKDTSADVIFASRDSLGKNPEACGRFDLCIVDEAHLVNPKAKTQYQKIFSALDFKYVVGLTGTPWRLNGGNIWGDNGYFDSVAYNICLNLLVDRGYLSKYRYPEARKTIVDASSVEVASTGDYKKDALDAVSTPDDIVRACVDSWESEASARRCSIFFCTSLDHAKKVTDELVSRGYKTGYLDGTTKKRERAELLADAKAGFYECLVNVGVLTTGVDIPCIDTVIMLRPTKSAALYIQCMGRGLRLFEGKDDCLILDYAGNVERFGTDLGKPIVKDVRVEMNKEHSDEPRDDEKTLKGPKICPECLTEVGRYDFVCVACGYQFLKLDSTPFGLLKEGKFNRVENYKYYKSSTQKGEPCYIVEWHLGRQKPLKEWLLHEREGYFGERMRKKLNILLTDLVTEIKLGNVTERFPRVLEYKVSSDIEKTPVEESEEEPRITDLFGGLRF